MKKIIYLSIVVLLTGCSQSPSPNQVKNETPPVNTTNQPEKQVEKVTKNEKPDIVNQVNTPKAAVQLNPLPTADQQSGNFKKQPETVDKVIKPEEVKVLKPLPLPVNAELIPDPANTVNNGAPNFNVARPVADGKRNAYLSLFFKDPAKVRWSWTKYEFVSLAGADVTHVNILLKEYNIKSVEGVESVSGRTEEQLAAEEKAAEAKYKTDYPNKASIYYLSGENVNVKELVQKLRQEPTVLSTNENNG